VISGVSCVKSICIAPKW